MALQCDDEGRRDAKSGERFRRKVITDRAADYKGSDHRLEEGEIGGQKNMPVIGKTIPLMAFPRFCEVHDACEGVVGEWLHEEAGDYGEQNGGYEVSPEATLVAGPDFHAYRDDGQRNQLWYVVEKGVEREVAEIDELHEWVAEESLMNGREEKNTSAQRRAKLCFRMPCGRCVKR